MPEPTPDGVPGTDLPRPRRPPLWARRRVEVQDESMHPTLHPGDRLLVDRHAFRDRSPRVGEIVVVVDPEGPSRWLVKRVLAVGPGRFWSTSRGPIPLGATAPGAAPDLPSEAVETVDLDRGAIWVQGDAADVSRDSRRFGPIRATDVVGRVFRCYAPAARRRDF